MARGTQLGQLVTQLRAELGQAINPALGVDYEEHLKHVIRRTQMTLYDNYEWPHLTVWASKTLAAGSRYYDVPSEIDVYDNVVEVSQYWDTGRYDVLRGIGVEEYAIYDPDLDQRSDPVQRWDVVYTGSAEQIEVWPIPATNAGTLKFRGKRALADLVDEADTAVLDDALIVLTAAAELLAEKRPKLARIKAGLAQTRLNDLRRVSQKATQVTTLGASLYRPRQRERLHAPRG